VVTEDHYQQINRYLDDCAGILQEDPPDGARIEELLQQWFACQPQVMRQWLSRQDLTTQAPEQKTQPASEPSAEDLVAYWKQEMTKAVQAGDAQRINETQQQLLKAMQRRRN